MSLSSKASYVTALWPMTDASGNATDDVGSAALTENGTISSVSGGPFGNVRRIESGEYFSSSSSALQAGSGSFFLWAWINMTRVDDSQSIVFKGNSDPHVEYSLDYIGGGTAKFRIAASTGSGLAGYTTQLGNTFGTPSTSQWLLVAARFAQDAGKLGISINGGAWDEATFTGPIYNASHDFRVGLDTFSQQFPGDLGECGLMKGAYLDGTEIAELWNSGSGVAFADWGGGGGGVVVPVFMNQYRQRWR